MIDALTLTAAPNSSFPWLEKLDYFKQNPVTQFKPGLNVLFGANGSGKSTIIKLLAQSLAAEQGGYSVVTESWVRTLFEFDGEFTFPGKVTHDGCPIMCFDARAKEGLIGGGFDDDFFRLGLENTMAEGSTGQLGLRRLERILKALTADRPPTQKATAPNTKEPAAAKLKKRTPKPLQRGAPQRHSIGEDTFPSTIEWRIKRNSVNSYWQQRLAVVEKLLEAKCAPGPKTVLLDEPESGFSLPWQAGLWHNILAKTDPAQFQVIVATHSPFAVALPGVNYIELTPGYLTESEAAVASLCTRWA